MPELRMDKKKCREYHIGSEKIHWESNGLMSDEGFANGKFRLHISE